MVLMAEEYHDIEKKYMEIIEKIRKDRTMELVDAIKEGEITEDELKDIYEILYEEWDYENIEKLFLYVKKGKAKTSMRKEKYKYEIIGNALEVYLSTYYNENEKTGEIEDIEYYVIVPLENHVRVIIKSFENIAGNKEYKKEIYHYNLYGWVKEEEELYKHERYI